MEEEYKKYYYKFRMSMPLELKIGYSRKRIRDFYNQMNGDVYVSFSGGKDSTVLYHLVKQEYPKVKAIFVDTGVEFPEIRQFVRENKEVEVIRPDTTFKEVCEKYGYPVVSKEQSNYIGEVQKYGKDSKLGKMRMRSKESYIISEKWKFLVDAPFKISDMCCDWLKKKPSVLIEKKYGLWPYVGIMADEGSLRLNSWIKHGCNVYGEKRKKSQPLIFWNEKDILDYIKIYDIKISSIYNMGYRRTGCVYCMFGLHLEKINKYHLMQNTHPKLWDYAIRKENGLGLGEIMDYCGISYRCNSEQLNLF